ncbi:hypothetical protein ACFLZI_00125 [Nitrospirota bacterium]
MDNGITGEREETLGMLIVASLVKQIYGQVEIISSGGTEFRITFKGVGDNVT